LTKILVPVDGSAASVRAVRLAVDHVKALRAEVSLILVNVQNFSTLGLPEGTEIMPAAWIAEKEESAAREALKEAVAVCREAGIGYVTRAERAVLQQRSIVWLARSAFSISSWGPGGLEGSAACSLDRSLRSCCI
jgi:nucleotide-binding universal stress UspA family protein